MTTQECRDLYTKLFLAVLPAVVGGSIARGGTSDSAEVAMHADEIVNAAFNELSRSLDAREGEDDWEEAATPLLDALKRNLVQ
jgi:hypothetical protein